MSMRIYAMGGDSLTQEDDDIATKIDRLHAAALDSLSHPEERSSLWAFAVADVYRMEARRLQLATHATPTA